MRRGTPARAPGRMGLLPSTPGHGTPTREPRFWDSELCRWHSSYTEPSGTPTTRGRRSSRAAPRPPALHLPCSPATSAEPGAALAGQHCQARRPSSGGSQPTASRAAAPCTRGRTAGQRYVKLSQIAETLRTSSAKLCHARGATSATRLHKERNHFLKISYSRPTTAYKWKLCTGNKK